MSPSDLTYGEAVRVFLARRQFHEAVTTRG
jgi:hypothetical protein